MCDCDHITTAKYLHCYKLDCNVCFLTTCSKRAREITERLEKFKEQSVKGGLRVGRLKHVTISFPRESDRAQFETDKSYREFKRKTIYPLLRDIGLIGGFVFLHVWSTVCLNCNKSEYACTCPRNDLVKVVNIHVHAIGYGYLISSEEFNKRFPSFILQAHKPRTRAYSTVFYALRKGALYKKENKHVASPYSAFGWLTGSKFKKTKTTAHHQRARCEKCASPMKITAIQHTPVPPTTEYSFVTKTREFKIKGLHELKTTLDAIALERRSRREVAPHHDEATNANKSEKQTLGKIAKQLSETARAIEALTSGSESSPSTPHIPNAPPPSAKNPALPSPRVLDEVTENFLKKIKGAPPNADPKPQESIEDETELVLESFDGDKNISESIAEEAKPAPVPKPPPKGGEILSAFVVELRDKSIAIKSDDGDLAYLPKKCVRNASELREGERMDIAIAYDPAWFPKIKWFRAKRAT